MPQSNTESTTDVALFNPEEERKGFFSNLFGSGGVKTSDYSTKPTLKPGNKGGKVKELQGLLNQVGSAVEVDGDFGPDTTAAVQSFQVRASLVRSGIVDTATWAALYGTIAKAAQAGKKAVRKAKTAATAGKAGDLLSQLFGAKAAEPTALVTTYAEPTEITETKTSWTPYIVGGVVLVGVLGGLYVYTQQGE